MNLNYVETVSKFTHELTNFAVHFISRRAECKMGKWLGDEFVQYAVSMS